MARAKIELLLPGNIFCPGLKSKSMKRTIIAIAIGMTLYFPHPVNSQTSSGAKNGSVFTNDNSVGSFPFSSPSNAALSDGNVSAATATLSLLSANTQYLKASGFGFTIPNSSSITGIKVDVEKKATGINILANVKDNSVRLVKAGTPVGSNYAKSSSWSSSSSYFTYGGNNDLWGTTWTRTDINSGNFGIAFSAEINGLISLLPSAQIDHIRMTVYFNTILPVSISQFSVETGADHSANIAYSYTSDENTGHFNIQRKSGNADWQTIKTYKPGIVVKEQTITYLDTGCHDHQAYYRIEVVAGDGSPAYSKIITVSWAPGKFSLYPNPCTTEININHSVHAAIVYCMGADGSPWRLPVLLNGTEKAKLDIQRLPPGTYVLNIDGMRGIFIKK